MVKFVVVFPKKHLLRIPSDLIAVPAPVLPPLPQLLPEVLAAHRQHLLFPLLLAAAQQQSLALMFY